MGLWLKKLPQQIVRLAMSLICLLTETYNHKEPAPLKYDAIRALRRARQDFSAPCNLLQRRL